MKVKISGIREVTGQRSAPILFCVSGRGVRSMNHKSLLPQRELQLNSRRTVSTAAGHAVPNVSLIEPSVDLKVRNGCSINRIGDQVSGIVQYH